MKAKDKLSEHYSISPFGADGGAQNDRALVYAGPFLLEIKNTKKRKNFIPYHDLHHIVSGYSNTRIGEGEVGVWELGTDCWREPQAILLNLAGMATGLLYSPSRMYRAFVNGAGKNNLYVISPDVLFEMDYAAILDHVNSRPKHHQASILIKLRFLAYFVSSLAVIPPLVLWGGAYKLSKRT